ncbi:MAG: hypothetical protein E7256_04740 [Lachnospiraceae bacterium]|nr:hypothetical protein [Lachnospiraceae bacterium]
MERVRIARRIMIFWTLFIGIGAVAGSAGMLLKPDGSIMSMQGLLPYFQVLPFADVLFQNFIFPGIALFIVNGISNLTAAFLIYKRKKAGPYLGCLFGITLMLWIMIQFVIFPANFMSITYFIFGLLQFACGLAYIIFLKQSEFSFSEKAYKNIGKKPDVLVAYFSRMGYSKKIAYEKADEIGADVYEITTPERTKGFLGFAWLGRFGMHGWAMPIDAVSRNIGKYKKVIFVYPIHVFSAASPVKGFCKACKGKVKKAEYIAVHFRKDNDYSKSFSWMDEALGIHADKRESIVCKYGNVIRKRQFD